MQSDKPKTINEALKILAYNEFLWTDHAGKHIHPHPKDRQTVTSLAESQYAWTEKQAKLAVMILKRYLTKFQTNKIDIKQLLDNPVYDEDFRVISFDKSIRKYSNDEGIDCIEMRFPYNKKIIQLIRCLKDKKDLPGLYATYDGESKKWTFLQTDVTTYYLTLVAVRYDFEFLTPSLLDDYDKVKSEIIGHVQPTAKLEGSEIVISHAPESMKEYWDNHVKSKPLLQQVDMLKNLGLSTSGIQVEAKSKLAEKIAHHEYHKLWIDSHTYSKSQVIQSLIELDAFPLIMPCHSDVHETQEVTEFWEWLNVFKANGIDIMTECSWGFDLREPVYDKDQDYNPKQMKLSNQISKESFENVYELYQMSKQFKFVDDKTKVLFVRNRIPRALIKSKVKPKSTLIALGGGYYATGTDNLKRLLENLPKKLYYSDHQPSSWDWHDHVIEKL